MKRLLILSASAGAGHVRAGQALEEAARRLYPGALVRHDDVLDLTSRAYRKAYAGGFLAMVNHAPALWGHLYQSSDRGAERRLHEKVARLYDKLEFARFRRYLRELAPDVVLATHFLPLQVLGPGRARGKDAFPVGVVVTDFDVHAFWVNETADRYFVATDELKARLAGRGIEERRIEPTGIPISGAFSSPRDAGAVRAELHLDAAVPTVLVMSGGAGVGSMEEAVDAALAAAPGGKVQVLAVAGRNDELRARLEAKRAGRGATLVTFGFTDRIADLMSISSLAVTKSGGLTTSECLAMGLPMVIRDPIPGQEDRNADAVLEAGAGVKAHGADSLSFKLRALLADPARLGRMREAARAAGRPRAAEAIVTIAAKRLARA